MPEAAQPAPPARWNPVLVRELRNSIRSETRSAYTTPVSFALLASIILGGAYWLAAAGYFHVLTSEIAFFVIAFFQSLAVARPDAIHAAAVVQTERDQNTLMSVLSAPLPPRSYANGLLLHSAYHVLNRSLAFLPLYLIIFLFGGFDILPFAGFQAGLVINRLMFDCLALSMVSNVLTPEAVAARAKRLQALGIKPAAAQRSATVQVPLLQILPLMFSVAAVILLWAVTVTGRAGQQMLPPGLTRSDVEIAALLHPLATLACPGPIRLFGWRVPVWPFVYSVWAAAGACWYAGFLYRFRLRKVRRSPLLRIASLGGFLLLLVLAIGLTWHRHAGPARASLPTFGLAVASGVTLLMILKLLSRNTVAQVITPEKWQLLPRTDILVARAGNQPGWLLLIMVIGAAAVIGGLYATFGALQAAGGAVVCLLIVLVAMTVMLLDTATHVAREARALVEAEQARPPDTETAQLPDAARAAQRSPAGPSANTLGLLIAYTLLLTPAEVVLSQVSHYGANASIPYLSTVAYYVEPFQYLNPVAFLVRLARAASAPVAGIIQRPPVIDLGFTRLDYFELSLLCWAALLVVSALIYRHSARRYRATYDQLNVESSAPPGH